MKLRTLWLGIILLISVPTAAALSINFFEEFPDNQTVKKACELNFSFQLYLAAEDLEQFYLFQSKIKACSSQTELIYWPTLTLEEGYWISPWSDPQALQELFDKLINRTDQTEMKIMLDLEPPIHKIQIWKRRKQAQENQARIRQFLSSAEEHHLEIILVEKALPSWLTERVGLSYPERQNKRVQMYYSSFRRVLLPEVIVETKLKQKLKQAAAQDFSLGLGLIAPGIHGDEPTYSPEILARELQWASQAGLREVVIFRLGGLTPEYLKVLEQFRENYREMR